MRPHPHSTLGHGDTLRVATYNIHKGVLRELFGLKHVNRIQELRARLHELEANLILLQEVQGQHDRNAARFEQWPDEPQDTFLAKSPTLKRAFESAYGRNATYLHGHHGNALLSQYPILRQENRDVSDHAMEKRGVLVDGEHLLDDQPFDALHFLAEGGDLVLEGVELAVVLRLHQLVLVFRDPLLGHRRLALELTPCRLRGRQRRRPRRVRRGARRCRSCRWSRCRSRW